MPPFIYLNGYPGVGKLTVAKELCKLLPHSKVVDNHLLIDPVAAVFDRTAEEYRPLRQVLRRAVLTSIATAKSTEDVTFIFTDSQSSNSLGRSSAADYQNAAATRGSLFIPIVLTCDSEENLKRASGGGRGSSDTKLTDLDTLRDIREKEDLFRFEDDNQMDLDITCLPPSEAAAKILQHVVRVLGKVSDGEKNEILN
ncbi:hypothetical protein C8A05DRAFT_14037 [Staphylotrichum tortipilum]|uniref:Uncharacterized protein n=1 Tax=Staphylotrichum tortipilum TaxID=2831512 RepID=A0AAN6RVA6_9PEZI|nr:hypothetical protein C8A05DRAFT_14037 [Staphylotrichum longicolle]